MASIFMKKFRLKSRECLERSNAFTLIELLVVISVITLLTGILMPILGAARRAGQRTACRGNLHSIAMGFKMYLDDNSNTYPPATAYPMNDPNSSITVFLRPYIKEPMAFLCPGDKGKRVFLLEGTSYQYNEYLGAPLPPAPPPNGLGGVLTKKYLDSQSGERNVEVMFDYERFHGKTKGVNYLYADGHVGNSSMQ